MTYPEIKALMAAKIAADDLTGALELMTRENAIVVEKYNTERQHTLDKYQAYRAINEFKDYSDTDFDNLFNQS